MFGFIFSFAGDIGSISIRLWLGGESVHWSIKVPVALSVLFLGNSDEELQLS